MTTIAVSKRAVAWDSRLTIGDEKVDHPNDKVITHDNVIYGASGDSIDMEELISFLTEEGCRPPKGEWEAVFINKTGVFWLSSKTLCPVQMTPPIAIGSGGKFARGAMLAGAPAVKAVEIAALCDPHTGGPIYYYNISAVTRGRKCR